MNPNAANLDSPEFDPQEYIKTELEQHYDPTTKCYTINNCIVLSRLCLDALVKGSP